VRGRIVRTIARLARIGWFRSVETSGLERLADPGPLLMVANHAGGFVDPMLLMSVAPRSPRFLAMASLFRPGLGALLRFAGAVPVHRRTEGSTEANVSTFAACFEVLAAGGVIALFPEGQASDAVHLLPVKTGAARIALGARSNGARGLRIVPVGLIYEDKGSARARAFVRVGAPIDLDDEVARLPGGARDEQDREAVTALTTLIEGRLAEAALDFADAAQAADLFFAARVALRRAGGNPAWAPPLSALEDLAGRLAEAPPEAQASVRDAAANYRAALEANDLPDAVVAAGPRSRLDGPRIAGGVLTVLAIPLAAVGAVANAVPAAVVHLTGRRPAAPVTLATIKFLVGFVCFPLTWLALRSFVFDAAARPWLWTVLAGPVCGLVAAVVGDRWRRIRLARLRPSRMMVPSQAAEDLGERRSWLVDQVAAALDAAGHGPGTAGSLGNRP
jgi:1-acyl-sn-glycerol-3-phosphate acyltransferase